MLTLLIGTDWISNRNTIMQMIAQDVAKEQSGRILLVPELISHDTERRLCEAAGDTVSRFVEVLSFSRLTRRVCESMGCAVVECLDNGGRMVAMAAAARQMHSKLKAYASIETKPEFLTGLLDAVDEFKRCCITPDDLMRVSKITAGNFAQKMEELSILYSGYDAVCAMGKRDPRDQMSWLLDKLNDSDFAQQHVFYIDGFPDFTRQHMEILAHLVRFCPKVVISINCDKPNSSRLAFEKAADTASEILKIAKQMNVEVHIQQISSRKDGLSVVRQKMFQGPITPGEAYEVLQVHRAQSVYHECRIAAEKIITLVQNGARYRDIAVVCTDPAKYHNMINMVFSRCRIPVYQSGTEDILEKSVISTVLNALDAALSGFEQLDVIRYMKSAVSPLDADSADRLENYAIMWNIYGNLWLNELVNHPDGLGAEWSEDAQNRLYELNQMCRLVIDPLSRMQKAFAASSCLKDQILALYRFLEDIHLAERLSDLAAHLDQDGDNRGAQILNQLWEILVCALEQMYDVLGQMHWDTEVFPRLLRLLLSQYDVGTIPTVLDSVIMGPVSAMRCQQVDHLIVVGAEEGSFPGYNGSAGVLSDQERVTLRQMGVPLTGGAMDGLQAEFAEIYGVLCGAMQSISVSCPSDQPSFIFRRLMELAGGETVINTDFTSARIDPLEAGAAMVRYSYEEESSQLGVHNQYKLIRNRIEHDLGNVSSEMIQSLYGKELKLSASQVDKQADCRLAYFLKYGIRARERKRITVDPAEFGTFIHAVLEQTVREVMDCGGFHVVPMETTLEIANKYAGIYTQERFSTIESERIQYLFRRNGHELKLVVEELWRELHGSKFVPIECELHFDDHSPLPSISIPNKSVEAKLRGVVDRIDAWQEDGRNYFRVVDYKTGKKDFDYCDVFNGLGLQMLLYLFALEDEGEVLLGHHPIPAGVQYFPARVPFIAAGALLSDHEAQNLRTKEWKRSGLILCDEDVLNAMEAVEKPSRLNYSRSKDGTITGNVADREMFRLLRGYVFRFLGGMVDEIMSGCVTPNPYTRGNSHNACAFCPYDAVCHSETVAGRRNYQAMNADRFWTEIEKEMKKHGGKTDN